MWRQTVLLLSLGYVVTSAHAIVNGAPVSQRSFEDDYPWAVALENRKTGKVCTAALISPTFVITAAHCASAKKRVWVGHTSRSQAREVEPLRAVRHPAYNRETHRFDIGLVKLAAPVDLRPVPVASVAEYFLFVNPDAAATIYGWGRRPGLGGQSDQLYSAEVQLHGLQLGSEAMVFSDDAGPCGGDSGGPMTVMGLDGVPVLVGVASRTEGGLCAKGGGLAIYTNVVGVREFIEQNVDDLPGKE